MPERQGEAAAVRNLKAAVLHGKTEIGDGRIAKEGCHELITGVQVHLLRRALLLHDALLHQHDLVGDAHGLLLIVGHKYGGHAGLDLDPADLLPHFQTQAGVQIGQRLIQQQDLGPLHQRPGDGHPLLLAAGELAGLPLQKISDLHQLCHFLRAFPDLLFFDFLIHQGKRNVLLHGHVGIEGVVLENEADPPLFRRQQRNIPVSEKDPAGRRALKAGDQIQQR